MGGATGSSVDGTVDGDLVTTMLAEHGRWAYRLIRAIEGIESDAPPPPDIVLADDGCALGRWLNGDAVAALDPAARSEVSDRHRHLHESAANLLTLAAEGEKERALAAVAPGGEFSLAANGLAVTVERWRTAGSPGQAARAISVASKTVGDELLGSVSLIRAEAAAAATATRDVADAIHQLSDDVGEGLSTITEIAGAAGTTAHEADASRARSEDTHHLVAGLRQSVGRIGEALALIEQIARKTNIIVLNANIEAVRAGEAGKGFRVVAHEVKQLADGISTATREVKGVTEAARTDTDTILGDVTEFRTSIARIVDNQSAIGRAIDRHRSAAERMRDRLLTAAESIEAVEGNAESAAHGADSAVAVGSVVAERLRSISSATGQPTRRYQLRGSRGWFLTPDLAHLVECGPDGGSVAYYGVPHGAPVGELRPQQPTPPCGGDLFVSPDGRLVLVSWDEAGAFRWWDVGSAAPGASFQNGGVPLWVAVDEENWRLVAPTGRMAQVGRYRREVATIWDLSTGRAVEDVAVDDLSKAGEYHTHSVADMFGAEAVSADEHLYAVARRDDGGASFVLYDGQSGRERFRTADPDATGVRVAFAGELLLAHWESRDAGWVDVFDL